MQPHPAIKSIAFTPTGQTAIDLDAIRAKKAEGVAKLPRWLAKIRVRDEELDRGTWRHAPEIGRAVGLNKRDATEALQALADEGTIEKMDFTNGTGWRGRLVVVAPQPLKVFEMRVASARSLMLFLQTVENHARQRSVSMASVVIAGATEAPIGEPHNATLWLERLPTGPAFTVRLT